MKLDLFHAVQRITRTLPKKHPHFHKCVEDLRLVYRVDGDMGKQRLLSTPPSDILLFKLNCFVEKWKNVTDIYGNSILTSSSMQAFSNLQKHIKTGCLSDIPPGMGTRNERFHRHLKSTIHRSRIGILLAYALLTILIHAHNNSCIVSGKRMVQSVSTHSHTNSSSSERRYPPIGICPKARLSICDSFVDNDQWERDESLQEVLSSDVLLFYHEQEHLNL